MEKINHPNLLVIGGTGFIGRHLIKNVVEKNWDVTSVSLTVPEQCKQEKAVRYLSLDLTKPSEAKTLLGENFNYVVNLGGYIDHKLFQHGGRELIDAHFKAVQNLVEVIPRESLKCFVQIGSSDEYGNATSPQNEDLRENPISPYSLGKVASTHFLQMLHQTESYPVVVLRLFLTYGPGQDAGRFLPQIIKGCFSAEDFPTSQGEQLRDFCYIDDSVSGIIKSLECPIALGEVINIASGSPVKIRQVIEKVTELVGSGTPNYGKFPYRVGENMSLFADISKAEKLLGWKPYTSLDTGLLRTIEWYIRSTGHE
jgi:nucleoside-diphosphate-sugar epimerase